MAICSFMVILGVFIALFDHGASRGFTGNYNQAAMIQKASKITEKIDEPLVIRSKRSAEFSGSGKRKIDSEITEADCDGDGDGDGMPPKRSRRALENPNLAEAITDQIKHNHLEADYQEMRKRDGSASVNLFLAKLKQRLQENQPKETPQEQTDEKADDENNNKDSHDSVELSDEDNDILKRITALFNRRGSQDSDDVMTRDFRSNLENLGAKGEDYLTAEKVKDLLAEAFQKARMKRQTVEEVEHVDQHLQHAQAQNLFIAGHYATLGESGGEPSDGSSQETASKIKKRSVRRRHKRSRVMGYKALAMQHGRTVNDIIHV